MRKSSRLTESDLNRIVRRTIKEMDGDMKNTLEMYDFEKNKIENGIYQLKEFIEKGDKETALHITDVLLYKLKELDSYVQNMK